jgi:8-oxo-dGTP pyrophosphatase MutT (NUDIX family)
MRKLDVAVGVVARGQGAALEFLLHYNERWQSYSFPTHRCRSATSDRAEEALQAIADDVGLLHQPGKPVAEPIDSIIRVGRSGRTGELTEYHYHALAVDAQWIPNEYPSFAGRPIDMRYPTLWLPYDELKDHLRVAWSTKHIARAIVDRQDVALGIVTRLGPSETEYLLVWNKRYAGYFFPSERVCDDAEPAYFVYRAVTEDIGYAGDMDIEPVDSVDVEQFSQRYQRERGFLFRIYAAQPLADIDLLAPDSLLTANVPDLPRPAGTDPFVWLDAQAIESPPASITLSPTAASVWPTVKKGFPPSKRTSLRRSEAGLALISLTSAGQTEFLCQFHEKTKAFFLIGGHREAGESFRDCVIREVSEELSLAPADFSVANQPQKILHFHARSTSTKLDTEYDIHLFDVTVATGALAKVEADPRNTWLTADEVREELFHQGKRISSDMRRILLRSGLDG